MTPRPFRFGVQASTAADRTGWLELARTAEDLGYDTLTMPDHFGDQLAPVPALMAAADATTRLRVGALVFDNDYKHPVVLAKELATMDVLSGGRVEIGLGAGWMRSDYDASGIAYDAPGVRIDRLVEALAVIDGALTGERFSFTGQHYTIADYEGRPRPVQQPRPPILIGGGGRRMLTVAAQHADIVGINATLHEGAVGPEAVASMSREAVEAKLAIVRDAAGDRGVELNIRVFFFKVTDDHAGTVADIAAMVGVEPEMAAASPFVAVGSVGQIADELRRRRDELGFSYLIVGPDDVRPFAPVVAELAGE